MADESKSPDLRVARVSLPDEGHTIGNALQVVADSHEACAACAYKVEEDEQMRPTLSLSVFTAEQDPKVVLRESAHALRTIAEHVQQEWARAL